MKRRLLPLFNSFTGPYSLDEREEKSDGVRRRESCGGRSILNSLRGSRVSSALSSHEQKLKSCASRVSMPSKICRMSYSQSISQLLWRYGNTANRSHDISLVSDWVHGL